MHVIWQSLRYRPENVVKTYAGRIGDEYKVYEVDAKSKTIREMWFSRNELPDEVADKCDAQRGLAFNQVEFTAPKSETIS